MGEDSLASRVDLAEHERDLAKYSRDVTACVVANYLADRINNLPAALVGVRPVVERYQLRQAEYHAKRRYADHLQMVARKQAGDATEAVGS